MNCFISMYSNLLSTYFHISSIKKEDLQLNVLLTACYIFFLAYY